MTAGDQTFGRLQSLARSAAAKQRTAAPTQELLTRHLLESFLHRLTLTPHHDDFILKGGVLLAAYGVRRATKDADANAISADVTPDHLRRVVADIAQLDLSDGVSFHLDTLQIVQIRDTAQYPGFRIRIAASIGPWQGVCAWDVSTGDPIVPAPRIVQIERVLGDPIALLGYAPETAIAEKAVTILERGLTSTRWRDYVDIDQLCQAGFDPQELLRSATAVADYRGVTLTPIAPLLKGYGALHQAKWAAWRRKEQLDDRTEANLDDQITRVAAWIDPILGRPTG